MGHQRRFPGHGPSTGASEVQFGGGKVIGEGRPDAWPGVSKGVVGMSPVWATWTLTAWDSGKYSGVKLGGGPEKGRSREGSSEEMAQC